MGNTKLPFQQMSDFDLQVARNFYGPQFDPNGGERKLVSIIDREAIEQRRNGRHSTGNLLVDDSDEGDHPLNREQP